MADKRIYFFDTTLRDGIQAPGNFISIEKRVKIARFAEEVGIDIIEIGYPATSDYEKEAVKILSGEVKQARTCIFSRCNKNDIEVAREYCKNANSEIELLVSGSDHLLRYKRRQSRDESLAEMTDSILYAKSLFPEVSVVIEDSGRANQQYLHRIVTTAVAQGAVKIVLADTVGYCLPEEYKRLIKSVKEIAPETRISAHCHNDLGLAVANSLSALEAGADEIQTTFLGIGERTGNTALHTLMMALIARNEVFPQNHCVDVKAIYRISQDIAQLLSRQIPKEEPFIGDNAFSTEAGMHQAGILNHPATYELFDPLLINRQRRISLGPFSGKKAVSDFYSHYQIKLSPSELEAIYQRIKISQKSLSDKELDSIINAVKCAQ